MLNFTLRRAFESLLVLVLATVVGYGVIRMMGDPLAAYYASPYVSPKAIEQMRVHYGLDRPLPVQYLYWVKSLLTGDWGMSILTHQPVSTMFWERFPNSLILGMLSYLLTLMTGISMGLYAALHKDSWLDTAVTSLAVLGYSLPVFWLGLMLIGVFAVQFKQWGLPYLPVGGMYQLTAGPTLPQIMWHLILPAVTITIVISARYMRFVRASMVEVLQREYIRTAQAKGLSSSYIQRRHALRNAMLPLLTLAALDLPIILTGSVITETIFSWPGLGRLFWDAAQQVDYPIMMAILVFSAVAVILSNFVADFGYAYLDPRIRYA